MKRTESIHLTILASLAAFLTGCSDRPMRRCVDASNRVVDENNCVSRPGIGYIPYHWYYGGSRGYVPLGAVMNGGSTTPPRGGFSTPAGTTRGGIGAAGEAAASGHAGSGAHGGAGE